MYVHRRGPSSLTNSICNVIRFFKEISNKMELLLFRPEDFASQYNCSGIEVASVELENKSENLVKSILLLALSIFYFTLYIPCLASIWRHRHDNASYTILLYISVTDILELLLIGFIHSWLALQGAVFCSFPKFIYVHGVLCFECLWYAESSADVLLALERCIEMYSSDIGRLLFRDKRIYFWLLIPTVFAVYNFFYAIPPAVFNGIYFFYSFDPYAGYAPQITRVFEKPSQIYYDSVITCSIPLIYAIFILLLVLKSTGVNLNISALFRNSLLNQAFIQVFIICMLNFLTLTLWFYMQFNGASIALCTMAHFSWLHIHGFPPIVYLALNRTIRKDCLRYVKRIVGASYSGLSTSHPQPNQTQPVLSQWAQKVANLKQSSRVLPTIA